MTLTRGHQFQFLQSARKYGFVGGYLAAFAIIASTVYYLPNYGWLEYFTAYHSQVVLQMLGIPASLAETSAGVMLNEFLVDKPCTGIQVVATFVGIVIPLPRLTWTKKAIGLAMVVAGVYLANIARIVIQIWVFYAGLFDWTTIHGPGGVALGVLTVALLVVLMDRFVPEFGDFVFSIFKRK